MDEHLELIPLRGVPTIEAGDSVAEIVCDALARAVESGASSPRDGDVCTVTSKLFSRAQDRFVALADVEASAEALTYGRRCERDPRLVQLILNESIAVSRALPGVLITRHRLGFVSANAGIDASNVGRDETVLLLPEAPDRDAKTLREALRARFGVDMGVVVTDSHGRPFRFGTVGCAIGSAGVQALVNMNGGVDRFGRVLVSTEIGLADQIASAADMVAGQASEGTPAVFFSKFGASLVAAADDPGVSPLLRPATKDLYA